MKNNIAKNSCPVILEQAAFSICMSWRMRKREAANKIDGIVALAMSSLEAVRQGSETPIILGWV